MSVATGEPRSSQFLFQRNPSGWAGCVALCYDCFSEKPKLSNVELG